MNSEIIPVALFAYKRIDHLKLTIEGLKKNEVPLIYAFIDGPKDEREGMSVKEVYNLIKTIDWCDVKINKLEKNIGLGTSIRRGVSEMLEDFNYGIIVEDDIVMRPGAFEFMKNAIKYFHGKDEVPSISMWSHPVFGSGRNNNGFFSRRFVCWGWSSSFEFWRNYNGSPEQMHKQVVSQNIKYYKWGNDLTFQIEASKERDLWYAGFAMTHFLYDKLTYFPPETLVINIGKDDSGQNSKNGVKDDISLLRIPVKPIIVFPEINIPFNLDHKFRYYFDFQTIPFYSRLIRKVVNKTNNILKLKK